MDPIGNPYTPNAGSRPHELAGRAGELELNAEKTRLIEFGRHAVRDREARGLGRPETFQFLGFTHICGKTRKSGRFTSDWTRRSEGSWPPRSRIGV